MKIKSIMTCLMVFGFSGMALAQLDADPWATKSPVQDKRTRQTTPNTLTVEQPDYVGENTTWNTAMGQKEIAPDVNITNMLLMTQHLRNMGYQIPDGLDNLINTAPAKLRNEIYTAMYQLKHSDHPIAHMEEGLAGIFERNTGLSLENLIMNSLRIIDARR